MPFRSLDAIVFVEEPPEFRIKSGLVHITQQIGGIHFERVMLLSTFQQAIDDAAAALLEHHSKCGEVIPVEFDSKFERRFKGEEKSA